MFEIILYLNIKYIDADQAAHGAHLEQGARKGISCGL